MENNKTPMLDNSVVTFDLTRGEITALNGDKMEGYFATAVRLGGRTPLFFASASALLKLRDQINGLPEASK